MNLEKVGRYPYIVEPFHADFKGDLFLGVLGNHLLNSAGFHASERDFGIASLNKNQYTWVLSRLAIELNRMPRQYENYTIETWIEKVYRLFTDRNFTITDNSGRCYGYARSVWAMIDLQTRKPINLFAVKDGTIAEYVEHEKSCPIAQPSRIMLTQEATLLHSQKAQYTDIDVNGHVNSIKYLEHIVNSFPKSVFDQKAIKRVEIAYVAESYYGDTLNFYGRQVDANNVCEMEVKRQVNDNEVNEETVCRVKFEFIDN